MNSRRLEVLRHLPRSSRFPLEVLVPQNALFHFPPSAMICQLIFRNMHKLWHNITYFLKCIFSTDKIQSQFIPAIEVSSRCQNFCSHGFWHTNLQWTHIMCFKMTLDICCPNFSWKFHDVSSLAQGYLLGGKFLLALSIRNFNYFWLPLHLFPWEGACWQVWWRMHTCTQPVCEEQLPFVAREEWRGVPVPFCHGPFPDVMLGLWACNIFALVRRMYIPASDISLYKKTKQKNKKKSLTTAASEYVNALFIFLVCLFSLPLCIT